MKIDLDLPHSLVVSLLVRCQAEKVELDDVVAAWLRRAERQDRSLMPRSEATAKVVNLDPR